METAPKRPWYRLHWLTWLVIVVVTFEMVDVQRDEHLGDSAITGQKLYYCGWPLIHCLIETSEWYGAGSRYSRTEISEWRDWELLVNCVVSVLLIASTLFVCEMWTRNERHGQFGLRHLFSIVAILCSLLGLARIEWSDMFLANPGFTYQRRLIDWRDVAHPVRWPFLFALACTVYLLGWLAYAGALRIWSFRRGTRR